MLEISASDTKEIRRAVEQLEAPGFLIKVVTWLGWPLERGIGSLPKKAQAGIANVTKKALTFSLDAAMKTMDLGRQSPARNIWHKVAAGTAGAAGGMFGLAGLAIELPVSTGIMLRSIADIARAEGEDLRTIEGRLQCVSVFGMGGRSESDDASETAYYASRVVLSRAVRDAAAQVAKHAGEEAAKVAGGPVMRLVGLLTQRFSPQVAEKVLATGIPVIGAVGGSAINVLFIDHYQSVAHGHFTIRRLERKYGEEAVKELYVKLTRELVARRGQA